MVLFCPCCSFKVSAPIHLHCMPIAVWKSSTTLYFVLLRRKKVTGLEHHGEHMICKQTVLVRERDKTILQYSQHLLYKFPQFFHCTAFCQFRTLNLILLKNIVISSLTFLCIRLENALLSWFCFACIVDASFLLFSHVFFCLPIYTARIYSLSLHLVKVVLRFISVTVDE